jgi:hypothetical protein
LREEGLVEMDVCHFIEKNMWPKDRQMEETVAAAVALFSPPHRMKQPSIIYRTYVQQNVVVLVKAPQGTVYQVKI